MTERTDDKQVPLWERLRFLVKERRHVQIGVVEGEIIAAANGLEYASLRLKQLAPYHEERSCPSCTRPATKVIADACGEDPCPLRGTFAPSHELPPVDKKPCRDVPEPAAISSTAPLKVVAWLHQHHTTAYVITDTVKQLWEKAGKPDHVKNYTVPLYFGESLAARSERKPQAWDRTNLPAEPTRAMLDAWTDEMRGVAHHRPSTIWPGLHYSDHESLMVNAYQAMLSAAPKEKP